MRMPENSKTLFSSLGKSHIVKMAERLWTPLSCLQPGLQKESKLALIVLNRPIQTLLPLLKSVWAGASVKAVADGGGNRLYDCLSAEERTRYVPDILSGDLDSIRPEVQEFWKEKGSEIIRTPDQNFTDFTKCIQLLFQKVNRGEVQVETIVVFGAFGGRIDQTLSNINTVFTTAASSQLPVYLVGDESLACLLQPGRHKIMVNTGLEFEWCGLIPVGAECKDVSTTGLKWNLTNQSMKFGGLISSSNTYAPGSKEVTVSTDHPLLWMMGYQYPGT